MLSLQRSGTCVGTRPRAALGAAGSHLPAAALWPVRYSRGRAALRACAADDPRADATGGLNVVWLCLSPTAEKNLSSQGFFGLSENKKHQPLLLLLSLLLRTVVCVISDTGGTYAAQVTENATDSLGSRSLTTRDQEQAPPPRRECGPRRRQCQHFLRRVWFYCEVNCMNIVTNKKKCLLEIATWLYPLQKRWEETAKPRVLVSLLGTPPWQGSSSMWQVLGVPCDHLSPVSAWL